MKPMKTIFLLMVAGYIPALLTTNRASAQNTVSLEILESQKNEVALEKGVRPVKNNTVNMESISTRAIKAFAKTYKNVSGEQWEKIPDGYTAKFISNGVSNRIYFDAKGSWSGSLKGYGEDKLPDDVRDIVKRSYYDYSITYIQEVETIDSQGKPTYIVQMQDANTLKQVSVYEGEMTTWKEYKRGS